jgi:4-amino-4-deoxy-L-arabinose transferase-like glycosyltransferase
MQQHKWIWIIALIFFCKVLLLAFWITPLWTIPDEKGHFDYARSLADGRGIPVMGDDVIDLDIMQDARGRFDVGEPGRNQIAQHPPLYYFCAGIFWKIATYLTGDSQWLFRAPRLMSVIAGTLTLIVLYYLILLITRNRFAALGLAACVGFIPMYSHLSSGTNNDTTVILFAALAVYYWVRYLLHERMSDGYVMGMWLSLACVTKMTALVMVPPMLTVIILEMNQAWRIRIRHAVLMTLLTVLLPALWMMRAFRLHLEPAAATAGSIKSASTMMQASFIEYISRTDALESIFVHFWGMFGFSAAFRDVALARLGGWPLLFYTCSALVLLILLAWSLTRYLLIWHEKMKSVDVNSQPLSIIKAWHTLIVKWRGRDAASFILMALDLLLAFGTYWIVFESPGGTIRSIFFAVSVFVLCTSAVVFIKPLGRDARMVCYSLLVIAFFCTVFLWQLYEIYLRAGWARALQGRYFYPMIPLLLTAYSIAAAKWLRLPSWIFLAVAILFGLAEMATMLGQVIPLWRNI